MTWAAIPYGKIQKLNNALLIEGLPGIGNVGKVTTDFLIDQLKAKKIYEFRGSSIPHSVFVNEQSLVELPKIELFLKSLPDRDLLLLAGDVQPLTEEACYKFCEKVLEVCDNLGCTEIIALGGIGLKQVPKSPKVFCTGTEKKYVHTFAKSTGVNDRLYGIVGPIVGVSGVLVGLCTRSKRNALALLAETYSHPMYLGVKGAKELLKVIKKYLKLKIDLNHLDSEIAELEEEMMLRGREIQIPKAKIFGRGETSYIG